MDDRVVQFRVGVMVFATLIITAILIVLSGETPDFAKQIFQPTYTIRLWFPEASSIRKDTLVHRNGIVVGRVTDVRFVGEEDGAERPQEVDEAEFLSGVLVTTEIQKDIKLYKHDRSRIQTDLLGKPSLHFLRAKDEIAGKDLLDATKLHRGEIASDPLGALSMVTASLSELTPNVNQASKALANAGNAIDEAARKVSAIFDETTQTQLKDAIAGADSALASIQSIIGDEQNQAELKAALAGLPDSLNQIRTTMETAQARMDEVQAFTAQLGSEETVGRLDRATQHLDQVMADMAVFSESLRNPQGSLGLLLRDRQLYDRLNGTAQNIEDLSRKLRPIIDDVRVITDKIARDPSRLGLRGALQRWPGIK